jgi:hypothetical protein
MRGDAEHYGYSDSDSEADAMTRRVYILLLALLLSTRALPVGAQPTPTITLTTSATSTATVTPIPFSAAQSTTAILVSGVSTPPTLIDGEIAVASGPSTISYECCSNGGCATNCTPCAVATSVGALSDSSVDCTCTSNSMDICVVLTGEDSTGTTETTP